DANFDPSLWTDKGDALFQLGRYDEAQESYEIALGINPKFQGAVEGMQRIGEIETEMNSTTPGENNGVLPAEKEPTPTTAPLTGACGFLAVGIAAALIFFARWRDGGPPPR
ncbi:MAG TPA: tetratricopeptide repeat protein, partial [Methanoregulaceae archaeon]|nr:tetratricopeptide repeat protein [Methanoregulaceae archaeon]